MEMTRRRTLQLAVGTVAGSFLKGGNPTAHATPPPSSGDVGQAPAYRGANEAKPLPFDPAKLRGLSEKLITSHHQNNYSGAVKRLNQIQKQLGDLSRDAAPYQLGSLKREELIATNSMILHEIYFGNLGGDGKVSGTIVSLVTAQYGSWDRWEGEFRLACASLAGGSGWVVLEYNPRIGAVHTYWAADHTHSLAGGTPLLVMDMYEHAYHMDYGANAKGYIDAFFQDVNWGEVNRRAEETSVRKVPS